MNLKIFVSTHKECVRLEHPLLKYVQTGAISNTLVDDLDGVNTKDNISDKEFCELTTQYWAWKNKKLDYYGFCHYRRFFVFAEPHLQEDEGGNVIIDRIDENTLHTLGYNKDIESDFIQKYDILITKPYDTRLMGASNVYWQYKIGKSLYIKDLDCMIEVVSEKYPEYRKAITEYLEGHLFYQANMFIMKDEVFQEYNKWLFDILFEIEKRTDISLYSYESSRMIGHIGERLLGIFVKHAEMNDLHSIGVLQRCFVKDTNTLALDPVFKAGIPIIMASNDYFIPYTGATILSIINSSSDEKNYDIIIMGKDVTKDSKNVLNSLVSGKNNFSLRFVDVGSKLTRFSLSTEDHISMDTYSRFLIPILFNRYDKVLYLDGDLIIKADVSQLFDIDIGDKTIGAVQDIGYISLYNGNDKDIVDAADNILKLGDPYTYFNAGVMIINVKKLSNQYPGYELMEYASNHKYRYMDQDILNELFQDDKVILGMEWNVMHYLKGHREDLINTWAPKQLQKDYMDARKKPKIIHYAGNIKPWKDLYEDMGNEFWKTIEGSVLFPIIFSRFIYDTSPVQIIENNVVPVKNSIVKKLIDRIDRRIYE